MVRVGTSGWHYPGGRGTWNGIFYPSRRHRGFDELAYYAEHFDTVEINSTFYRMPEPDHTRAWSKRTPDGFLFSAKLYQQFTHPDMYLARGGSSDWDVSKTEIDLFRRGLEPLRDSGKLAVVLAQFPPSFHAGPETRAYLEWLLEGLADFALTVELRHASWYDDAAQTAALLSGHAASWARIDMPFAPDKHHRPAEDANTGHVYMRLHGRNAEHWWDHEDAEDRYNYLYSRAELEPFAEEARTASTAGKRAYLYLNNHFSAKAVANAAVLKHQLGQDLPGDYPREIIDRYPELEGLIVTSGLPL